MARTSPTVANWELMLRVREQAKRRGIKSKEIFGKLSITQQYWSLLSKGKGLLTEDRLQVLAPLLGFDADELAELSELRAAAEERGWQAEYSGMFQDELLRYYGLEDGAQSIRSFEFGVIPGLLQTEEYIRAIMSSITATGRPSEAEQRVRARLQRQRLLEGPDRVQMSVVIGQAPLMQQVGGPEVQRRQLLHLVELADTLGDSLDIRVIPFDARGSIAALNTATFHLLNFASTRMPTLGWLETAVYGLVVEETRRVAELSFLYDRVHSVALSRKESLRLIEQTAQQIG
ncbi:DUF5753 domain-containing protein [Nocardia macrotermitis]|uniref:DUF5753 domain-containing protein n=1 Tax=Nocardia macrotermitis TaxID=2585198 RepID=A0A7K0DC74_9NOCA|nr:DUF5753 domain-containing protein [Nocardia macrotermitis]MQY22902.1 hypothetical protein [Nocardia macrotermitis]